jgi:sugar lactone lactonase YvrE
MSAIFTVHVAGARTVLAGCASSGFSNGVGTNACLRYPSALSISSSGILYFTEQNNHCVRSFDPTSSTTTLVAGYFPTATSGLQDGSGTNAKFNSPNGIAVDTSGVIYISDTYNCAIRRISTSAKSVAFVLAWSLTCVSMYIFADNVVTTVAGGISSGYLDGLGTSARFTTVARMIATNGKIYVTDQGAGRLRLVDTTGS